MKSWINFLCYHHAKSEFNYSPALQNPLSNEAQEKEQQDQEELPRNCEEVKK